MPIISRTDPRDESRCTPLNVVPVSVEELPPDYYAILGLCFAFFAVLFKVKMYAWLTCLFSISSLANQRYSCTDSKNLVATISLIVLTFLSTHTTLAGRPVMAPVFPWLRQK
ncbi:unnamed protein product [Agarophyton chilense]